MAEREGLRQAGASAEYCVTPMRHASHRSGTDDAEGVVSGNIITTLPDDVLRLVLKHAGFRGKCNLQLVCKTFYTLLSNPPPGLWGELNIVTDIMKRKQKDKISRWLMRRLQGFASIRCETGLINHIDDCALLTLLAKLSGAFTKDTALTIVLAPGLTRKLLQGTPASPPDSKVLDYWATLSSCLMDLEITLDRRDPQLLQPAYLNELTRLTRLALSGVDHTGASAHGYDRYRYAFVLPKLKVLSLTCISVNALELQCPQLEVLHVEGCAMNETCLQAPLQHLHLEESILCFEPEGFPITDLAGLTYLCIDSTDGPTSEALPLMTRLHTLKLDIFSCLPPASLPNSLRDLTIVYSSDEIWDSSFIPVVQQLPSVESIRIDIRSHRRDLIGHISMDHSLEPFLAMRSLRHLQFLNSEYCKGDAPQVWKASALRQLGELEAEVVRSGKKLQLSF